MEIFNPVSANHSPYPFSLGQSPDGDPECGSTGWVYPHLIDTYRLFFAVKCGRKRKYVEVLGTTC